LINEKSRTIGRSFRIDERWLNILSEEAKNDGISPNALVNKVLQDYCLFHRYTKRFPSMLLTQKSFSSIIDACPKEALKTCAKKTGSTNAQDIFHTLGVSFDHENITYLIREIYGRYGNWFTYNHHLKNGKEVFHLRHNMGENWSMFIAEVISTLFDYGLNIKVKAEFLENTVTIDVPLSQHG
jgi:hypothetical protein